MSNAIPWQSGPVDDLTFPQWLNELDGEVKLLTGGLSYMDLPDFPYYDTYLDDTDPKTAARQVIWTSR